MRKKESILKEILFRELKSAQSRNARYSLRAFAKQLKISPATLSRLLSGNSNLSRKMAAHIVHQLRIDPKEASQLLKTEHDPYLSVQKEFDAKPLVENWYYSPIMCLAEMKSFKEDPNWISNRLGISPAQTKKALIYLQKIGFLQRNPQGHLVPVDIAISTKGLLPKNGPDKNLLDKVKLVRRNLLQTDNKLRELSDVSSIIVGTSPRKIPEAKRRIQRFRRSLAKFLDSGEKSEVYLIFVQLIPISKGL